MGLIALPLGARGVAGAWRLCVFSSTNNRDILQLEGSGDDAPTYARCEPTRKVSILRTAAEIAIPCAPGSVLCAYLFVKIDGLYVAQAIAALPMPQGRGPTRQHFNLVHPPEKRDLPPALTVRSTFEFIVADSAEATLSTVPRGDWHEIPASISVPWCTWTRADLHSAVYRAKVASPRPEEGYFDREGPLHQGEGTGLAIDWVGACPLPYWATDVADPEPPFLEPAILAMVCACVEQTVLRPEAHSVIASSADPEHRHACLAYFQLVVQVLLQLIPYHGDAYTPDSLGQASGYGVSCGPDQLTSPLAAGAGDCEDRAALIVRWCRHVFLNRARPNIEGESNLFRRARATVMKESAPEELSLAVLRNERLSGSDSHTVCLLPLSRESGEGYLLLDGVYPMGHQARDPADADILRALAGENLFFERASGASSAFARETRLYELVGMNRLRFLRHGTDRASSTYGAPLSALAKGALHQAPKYTHVIVNEGTGLIQAPEAWRLKPNPGFYGPGARYTVTYTSAVHDPGKSVYVTRTLHAPPVRTPAAFDDFVRLMEAKLKACKAATLSMKIVRFDVPGMLPPYLVLVFRK